MKTEAPALTGATITIDSPKSLATGYTTQAEVENLLQLVADIDNRRWTPPADSVGQTLIEKIIEDEGYRRARAQVREFAQVMLDREGLWWLNLVARPEELDGEGIRWIYATWNEWAA